MSNGIYIQKQYGVYVVFVQCEEYGQLLGRFHYLDDAIDRARYEQFQYFSNLQIVELNDA